MFFFSEKDPPGIFSAATSPKKSLIIEDTLRAIHGYRNSYVDIAFYGFCLPSRTQLEMLNMISYFSCRGDAMIYVANMFASSELEGGLGRLIYQHSPSMSIKTNHKQFRPRRMTKMIPKMD